MTQGVSWVVGRGGMLGSRVERALVRSGREVAVPPASITWTDERESRAGLGAGVDSLVEQAGTGAWSVFWCAGAGVTASSQGSLDQELDMFEALLDNLAHRGGGLGSLCLVSSAGGVYAGSRSPPFDEGSPPRPVSPYGETKRAMETTATRWAARTGNQLLVARVANLYGPGQDISKPQGLITQLVRAHLLRRPLHVYVPLDTTRDYIYVDDAANKIVASMDRLRELSGPPVTKVIASQQALTVGAVLGELGRILHRRLPIVLGASPMARHQSTDLRLKSVVWTDMDRQALTPFPAGVHATLLDVSARLREARL